VAMQRLIEMDPGAGRAGFDLKGREITKLMSGGQSEAAGVKVGWKVMQVAGKVVLEDSKLIIAELKKNIATGEKFQVLFSVPEGGDDDEEAGGDQTLQNLKQNGGKTSLEDIRKEQDRQNALELEREKQIADAEALGPVGPSWEEYEVLRQDFYALDTNRDGSLDTKEVTELMSAQLGRKATKREVKAFVKNMDLNSDGKVSLFEYITNMYGPGWVLQGDVASEELIQCYEAPYSYTLLGFPPEAFPDSAPPNGTYTRSGPDCKVHGMPVYQCDGEAGTYHTYYDRSGPKWWIGKGTHGTGGCVCTKVGDCSAPWAAKAKWELPNPDAEGEFTAVAGVRNIQIYITEEEFSASVRRRVRVAGSSHHPQHNGALSSFGVITAPCAPFYAAGCYTLRIGGTLVEGFEPDCVEELSEAEYLESQENSC